MISYLLNMSGVKCYLCHKGTMTGKQHKHHPGVAGGRWKRRAPKTQKVFKPNLHTAHIMVGRVNKKVRLCTKCLRKVKGKSSTMNLKPTIENTINPQSEVRPQAVI